jgi:two-component system phosphate regulon sensor histidine kinase PhoR
LRKESSNAEVIEDAIEHVNLILEDRQGKISTHFELCKNSISK